MKSRLCLRRYPAEPTNDFHSHAQGERKIAGAFLDLKGLKQLQLQAKERTIANVPRNVGRHLAKFSNMFDIPEHQEDAPCSSAWIVLVVNQVVALHWPREPHLLHTVAVETSRVNLAGLCVP